MPISVRAPAVSAFKTCSRDHRRLGFCKGYRSMPARVEIETVSWSFVDRGGDDARVENSNQYFHPATPADGQCDHCGGPVNLTLLPAVEYDRLGPDGPLDLIRAAAEEREHENKMLAADERSAAAHERSADLQERAVRAAERANELRAIELGLNGHDRDATMVAESSVEQISPVGDKSPAKPRRRTEA